MKFQPPIYYCQETGLYHRRISTNNVAHLGIYPVLYGYRVRAGLVRDRWGVSLEWCAGGNWETVELLYSAALAILASRDETDECFDGLPQHSRVKPFFKDPDFMQAIAACSPASIERQTLAPQPDYGFARWRTK